MPNTTNYSFPTPADTDLVKNGADAIRDLGDAVDTAMNTALGTKKAMGVLLSTVSFSAVASQSVNDVFSATYQNYRVIIFNTAASTAANTQFRFRVAGADDTNSVYELRLFEYVSNTIQGYDTATRNYATVMDYGTSVTSAVIDIFNPFNAAPKTANLHSFRSSKSVHGGFQFTNSTSFTGFTLIASSGTMTGTVRVYGYNN
jgi:hypothetical protein